MIMTLIEFVGIRTNSEGVPEDEENFEEAIKAVNGALVESRVPSEVRSIFEDSKCQNLTRDSKDFWVIARAVKDFVECEEEGQGSLPVRGSIPDMFSGKHRRHMCLPKLLVKSDENLKDTNFSEPRTPIHQWKASLALKCI